MSKQYLRTMLKSKLIMNKPISSGLY